MQLSIVLVSLTVGLIGAASYTSGFFQLPKFELPKLPPPCDVSLPQHNINLKRICQDLRKIDPAKNKLIYKLKRQDELNGFALISTNPVELRIIALADPFISHYTHNYLLQAVEAIGSVAKYGLAHHLGKEPINHISEYLSLSNWFQNAMENKGLLTKKLEKYTKLPSRHEDFINNKPAWISDKLFAQQRLAGTNPMSIQRVTNHGEEAMGLDWSKLKKTLNPKFSWDSAVGDALKSTDSLEDAIKQGRIYALRYELCDDMERAPDKTDHDPNRVMWDFFSPIALFASAKRGESNELVPVAIQMDYKPDSRVYTPKDGDNWRIAKLNLQLTDLGYSQMVEHLAKIHYFIEPFCVCLKRTLPPLHPLHQILKYHCREVIIPNTFGTPALTHQLGFMSNLFGYGEAGAKKLIRAARPLSTWEVTDFRGNIKKRGLDDKTLLPYFPYRDDGEKLLDVIESMVKEYVDVYYKSDEDVKNDYELKAYINEVSIQGTGKDGGIGRIEGLPPEIKSKKALREFVSRLICHVTIQHTALNYELADYGQYVPNTPTKLYNDTRVTEGEFSVYRLPNRETAALQSAFVNALASFRYDFLFDYYDKLPHEDGKNIVKKHYETLRGRIQSDLERENKKRLDNGDLTYPYYLPSWMTNGIQT